MCGTTKATARWSRSMARCGRQSRLSAGVLAAFWLLATMWAGSAVWAGSAAWTGSAASAAVAGQSPARVKYYVVPAAGHGSVGLFRIAELTLGDGSRYMQIFRLNKGRLQRNDGRLENPKLVEPGWVLELPKDAAGAGVHFGPLPRAAPAAGSAPPSQSSSASASPSASPTLSASPSPSSQPARAAATTSFSAVGFVVAGLALVIVGALAVAGALVLPLRGRRREVNGVGYGHGHDWPADHPSRPQEAVDYRGWPADHPSRPQEAVDYRGWVVPAAEPGFAELAPRQPQTLLRPPESVPEPAAGLRAEESQPAADALRVASLLISGAEAKAEKIRAEATTLRDQATAQAAALREATEREAEGLRASARAMSAELGQVAAFVTQRLAVPAPPDAEPGPGQAAPEPAATAPAKPAMRTKPAPPAAPKPRTTPAPKTTPATKPGQRSRQQRAARLMVAVAAGLALFGAVSGTTEAFMHGFSFFVFRSEGTGATLSNGPREDQGPGQPDAPGAHHKEHHRPTNGHARGSTH